MNNKPTYSEYKNNISKNVVKTADGRYFRVQNLDVLRRRSKLISVALIVLCYAAAFFMLPDLFSPNFAVELMLALIFISAFLGRFIDRIVYRFARLKELADYNGELRHEPEERRKFDPSKLAVAIGILVLLFVVLNSGSAVMLRSLFSSNTPAVSATVRALDDPKAPFLYSGDSADGSTADVRVPSMPEDTIVYVNIRAFHTSAEPLLTLDGKPLDMKNVSGIMRFTWFWEGYFKQEYTLAIPYGYFEKGALLHLGYNSWQCAWQLELE